MKRTKIVQIIQDFASYPNVGDIEANVLAAESVLENLETRYKLMQEEHNEHLNTFALQKEEQQQADGTLLSIKQEVIEAEQGKNKSYNFEYMELGIERGLECMKGTALELFDLKAEEFQLQHTLNKVTSPPIYIHSDATQT